MARGRVYNRIFNEDDWKLVNKENKNLIEDFCIEMKSNKKKESTINQYRNDLRLVAIYVLKELGNKPIIELNKKHFRNINLWFMNDLNLSSARCNRLMSAVRSMLDFAENDDDYDYDVNYAKKVKGLAKEEVREIVFLTDEQIHKLRDKLKEEKLYGHLLLLDLSYDSAGRRNECYQVLKEGLLERNNTNIVIGKRGKKFPLLYFDNTHESLRLYLEERGEDDIASLWVTGKGENKRELSYNTLYHWVVQMAEMISDIEGKEIPFNPHSLRHSALENMKNGSHYMCKKLGKVDGFDLNELKVFAHHESVETTMSYLKRDDDNVLEKMFSISIDK